MRLDAAAYFAISALVVVSMQAIGSRAESAEADTAPSGDCAPREYAGDGARITVECRKIDGLDTAVVRLSGDIESDDDRYFRRALLAADSDNVLVSLESGGGNLDAGIEIGRAIWFREAATVVEEGVCASACALAWLAGRPRFMAPKARIGFHAPWHGDPDRPEASTAGSAVVGGYLRDLGLTSAAIEYINEPGPEEMRWLTPEDADALNIALRPWQEEAAPPVAVAPPVEVAPSEPGSTFRDCDACPEMVVIPAGNFTMGSSKSETGHQADEEPQREVKLAAPFAVGRFEVTFDEWDACVADGGCAGHEPDDQHWGRGRRPVVDVSWEVANDYTEWLSRKTGRSYRLLSEAEWEYAARAGTATPYSFGATIHRDQANFGGEKTAEVGSYPASPFGLSDMHGNVWEWVADCYAESYRDAPADGAAVSPAGCNWRVVRGGAWNTTSPENMRTAFRLRRVADSTRDNVGFRVARALGETTEMSKGP